MPSEGRTSEDKKAKGRPGRKYPPKIDATPEEIAHVVLNAGQPNGPVKEQDYSCEGCEREVYYPETLYDDGLCPECHAVAQA